MGEERLNRTRDLVFKRTGYWPKHWLVEGIEKNRVILYPLMDPHKPL